MAANQPGKVILFTEAQDRAIASGLLRLVEIKGELLQRADKLDLVPSSENTARATECRNAAAKIAAVLWIIAPHF